MNHPETNEETGRPTSIPEAKFAACRARASSFPHLHVLCRSWPVFLLSSHSLARAARARSLALRSTQLCKYNTFLWPCEIDGCARVPRSPVAQARGSTARSAQMPNPWQSPVCVQRVRTQCRPVRRDHVSCAGSGSFVGSISEHLDRGAACARQ